MSAESARRRRAGVAHRERDGGDASRGASSSGSEEEAGAERVWRDLGRLCLANARTRADCERLRAKVGRLVAELSEEDLAEARARDLFGASGRHALRVAVGAAGSATAAVAASLLALGVKAPTASSFQGGSSLFPRSDGGTDVARWAADLYIEGGVEPLDLLLPIVNWYLFVASGPEAREPVLRVARACRPGARPGDERVRVPLAVENLYRFGRRRGKAAGELEEIVASISERFGPDAAMGNVIEYGLSM